MANRARGKRRSPGHSSVDMAAYKPLTLKQRVQDHADSAARSVMEQHPLHKRMRKDMAKAIMGVVKGSTGSARGPAPQGRRSSIFQ